MKTINKSIIYFATAAISMVGLTSCSDFLEEYSQDLAKVESWRDLDEVLLGDGYMHSAKIAAKYSGTKPSLDGDAGLDILHFMTDEFVMSELDDDCDYCGYKTSMFPFYTWQQDTGTDYLFKYIGGDAQYWNDLYKRINICNMVIYMCDELMSGGDDVVENERVQGEAHFLRGMCYFFLANLYAEPYNPATASTAPGVPIKTSETIEDVEFPRATLTDTYSQIISDFEQAANLLDGKTVKSKYHGNRTAALLMLSRVYLYMQDWDNAVDYAKQVLAINNKLQTVGTVSPGGNYVSLTSPETIFTMGHYAIASNFSDDKYGDYDLFFKLSDYIVNLYSDNDMRKGRYFGETHSGYSDNAFLKFNLQYPNFGGYSDVSSYCLLRTPEAYLTLAEASAYNGDETTARQTLDTYLRTRMYVLPNLDNMSGNALIDFIREERAREFLLEGHRWFDLRRYTVCQPYPWSKVIDHSYVYYSSTYGRNIDYIDTYRLELNDLAYTLPIPREIRQFQVSLGNNSRPARQANRVDFTDGDDDDDDWDW